MFIYTNPSKLAENKVWKVSFSLSFYIPSKEDTGVYGNQCVRLPYLCPEDLFRTVKPYATKFAMMTQQHDLECHAKMLRSYLSQKV